MQICDVLVAIAVAKTLYKCCVNVAKRAQHHTTSKMLHEKFEFLRLIAATKLAKAALSHRVYTCGNKSLRQNINEPMRERYMVCHIKLEN